MKKHFLKSLALFLSLAMLLIPLCACGADDESNNTQISSDGVASVSRVKFTMSGGDTFVVELYPEYAPQTVENFLSLVNSGFYNGLTFHRIVDNFMAQGGSASGDGSSSGNETTIQGEFSSNGFAQNTLLHERGTISMARSMDPNSASSQFFICYGACPSLDGDYAAFGKVIEGMETVDAFTTVERTVNAMGEMATPVVPLVIEKAEVVS